MKPARVPYADRPEVVREFCRCLWVHSPNPDNPQGPANAHLYVRHPGCPLHGDNAQPSPF
jgi:hypothetical protein